ncbi:hypothetical protein PLESTM_001657200, partial [Pleodorina starrii]
MLLRLQRLVCCGLPADARKPGDVAGPGPPVNADSTILMGNGQITGTEVHARSHNREDTAGDPRQPGMLSSLPPPHPPRAQPLPSQSCSQPPDTSELEQPVRLQTQHPGPGVATSPSSVSGPQRRSLLQLGSEPLNFDPPTRFEEQMRSSSATQHTCASQLEPLSPFVSPTPAAAAPLAAPDAPDPRPPDDARQNAHNNQPASRTQQQQQQQQTHPEQQDQTQIQPQCRSKRPGQGVLAAVEADVGTTMLMAAGSGAVQALTRHLMDSDEMPLSSSLSEPLLQSASPASNAPPEQHPHTQHRHPSSSGSAGTAVTAHSGARSPAGQVWAASAAAAAAAGGDGGGGRAAQSV